ncbi:hypothetical protein EVG20_g2555 [Dentipellis fragilis]|uniref:Ubiquinol-cytochrome c chaperone domain-containing protein n=1 Tax=Dentipellis fragilis TaxID=205917 RepID=A0A4Y9ZAN4_9AGAM|nr:hypothetical protein EVG20_g2555 [Dentipellis fragilis]
MPPPVARSGSLASPIPNAAAGRRAGRGTVAYWSECRLPPTFQSWFTITNLHIWLLTTRLRALPAPHGEHHIQGLIDHFFLDVEDRIREVLQPQAAPDALPSTAEQVRQQATAYYTAVAAPRSKGRGRAPESTVSRQMKIFREQWAGLGMAFDLGLIHGDAELAGAIWRNLLGARAAHGIAYPAAGTEGAEGFRRTINPSGEIEKYGKIDDEALRREEARDDGSGVHDFAPTEIDLYVRYPETMATLVAYVRREIVRLAAVPDEAIIGGKERGVVGKEAVGLDQLKFGRLADAQKVAGAIIEEVEL